MMRKFECSWKTKMFVCAAAVAMIVVFAAPAFSHGPSDVALSYDQEKQTLSVTVTHTPFSDSHYVKEIEVSRNGKSVAKYTYSAQPAGTFTYTYKIPALPGDVLEAKASCSKYGSKTGKTSIAPLR